MMSSVRNVAILTLLFVGCLDLRGQETDLIRKWERLNHEIAWAYQRGDYPTAVKLAEEAVRVAESVGKLSTQYAAALNNLAAMVASRGDYGRALPLYKQALAITEKALGPHHASTASCLNNLASLYESAGDYANALPLYNRAFTITEKALGPHHRSTATSLQNLAGLHESLGEYAQALPLYERALRIYEKALGVDHPSTAVCLNNLASLRKAMGEYARAFPLYERALRVLEKGLGVDHPFTANSLNNLASLHESLGQYAQALPLYLRALSVREKALGAEHPDTARSLNNVAGLYASLGQHARAMPLYERALEVREKVLGAEHPDTAESLNNLAALHTSLGEHARAIPLCARALEIREKALGAEHPDTAASLNSLAALYATLREHARALPLYQRAIRINEKRLGAHHPSTAVSLNNMAVLYLAIGEYARALPLAKRASEIKEKSLGADHPDTGTARMTLALARLLGGARRTGCRDLEGILTQRRTSVPRLVAFGSEAALRTHSISSLSVIGVALECRSRSFSDETLLDHLWHAKGRTTEELRNVIESIRLRGDAEARRILQIFYDADADVARLDTVVMPPEAMRAAWDRRSDAYQALIRGSDQFREAAAIPSVEQIRSKLPYEGSLVELVRYAPFLGEPGKLAGDPEYGAFVLTEKMVRWIRIGPAEPIDIEAASLLGALPIAANVEISRQIGSALFRLLLVPILREVPGSGPIFVSADGDLRTLPWPALVDDEGHYFAETPRTIHQVGSSRELVQRDYATKALDHIVSAPDYGEPAPDAEFNFASLRGAADEGNRIRREALQNAVVITAGEATKNRMFALAGPRVLHLATHGKYRIGNPSASLLALAGANEGPDGQLTAAEMAGLDLRGTSLVVLSACESAGSEASFADGLRGFQRSLAVAGARTQILTLWRIGDEPTAEFMSRFYKVLMSGKTKFEALRHAQQSFIAEGRSASEWAAFTMFGDPGPLGE